jgi:hypothetical protein
VSPESGVEEGPKSDPLGGPLSPEKEPLEELVSAAVAERGAPLGERDLPSTSGRGADTASPDSAADPDQGVEIKSEAEGDGEEQQEEWKSLLGASDCADDSDAGLGGGSDAAVDDDRGGSSDESEGGAETSALLGGEMVGTSALLEEGGEEDADVEAGLVAVRRAAASRGERAKLRLGRGSGGGGASGGAENEEGPFRGDGGKARGDANAEEDEGKSKEEEGKPKEDEGKFGGGEERPRDSEGKSTESTYEGEKPEDEAGKLKEDEGKPKGDEGKSKEDEDDDFDEGSGQDRLKNAAAAAMAAQPTGYTLSTTQVRTKVPFLLKHALREYQHIGLDWLVTMYEKRLNGILADEMGLGKTIQTIALLAYLACEKGIWGPHLIVVPTSVMLNWETELKKWCPAFKVLTYFGSAKERKVKRQGWSKPNSFHVCITTYRLVIQDQKMFRRKKWRYLILDEAHMIKNWRSQRWQVLLNFNSKRRILLTG